MRGGLSARWAEGQQSQNPGFWLSLSFQHLPLQDLLMIWFKTNWPITVDWEPCKIFFHYHGHMVFPKQNSPGHLWQWDDAGLYHCWTGAATLASDRLPLWQWLVKDCHITHVSMTASGLTNVTKLCFISKSPVGPSQENIWIRRENYSSCSLLLTDCALCVWSSQPWLAKFLCNLQYLLCGAEPVLTQYIFHLLRSFICCFGDQLSSKCQIEVLGIKAPVEVQGRLGHP